MFSICSKLLGLNLQFSENDCGKREIVQGECHVDSTVPHGLAGEIRSSPTERFVVGRRLVGSHASSQMNGY